MSLTSNNPLSLPSWPRWIETPQSVTITGRHLTAWRFKIVTFLGFLSAVALISCPWFGSANPLAHAVCDFVTGLMENFFNNGLPIPEADPKYMSPHVIYVSMGFVFLAMGVFFQFVFTKFYGSIFKTRTTVRFTADHIEIGWQRFPRTEGISVEFAVDEHPDLEKIPDRIWERAAQGKSIPSFRVKAATAARLFSIQYGYRKVLITSFATPEEADQFATMCAVAAGHTLTKTLIAFPVVGVQKDDR